MVRRFFVSLAAIAAGAAALAPPLAAAPAITITPSQPYGIYLPGETASWSIAGAEIAGGQIEYEVVDAYGARIIALRPLVSNIVAVPLASSGYREIRLMRRADSGAPPTLCALSGVIAVPYPAAWAPGRTPFGGQGPFMSVPQNLKDTAFYSFAEQAYFRRLGISWSRPSSYNIVTGSHSDLPTDFAAYADAWRKKVRNGLPVLNAGAVEIWNEPHNELHGAWTIDQFVATARATYDGIHRENPTIKILNNWDGSIHQYVAAGGKGTFDILALHPYSPGIFAAAPYPQSPESADLLGTIRNAAQQLRDNGLDGVEIWSTEYGWPTDPSYGGSATELDQARFLVRGSVLQLAAGVKRINPFRLTDVPFWGSRDGSFGLARADDTPKPSLCAYSILAQEIDALPYAGQFNLGRNIGAFLFGDDIRSVVVLWRPDAEQVIKLSVSGSGAELTDLFGRQNHLAPGEREIKIGPSPVYVAAARPARQAFPSLGHIDTGQPIDVFGSMSGLHTTAIWSLAKLHGNAAAVDSLKGPDMRFSNPIKGCDAVVRVNLARDALIVEAVVDGVGIVGRSEKPPVQCWNGDCVEVFLSTDGDRRLSYYRDGIDSHFLISPGDRGKGTLVFDVLQAKEVPGAEVSFQQVEHGYRLRSTIPLAALGNRPLNGVAPIAIAAAVDVAAGGSRDFQMMWPAWATYDDPRSWQPAKIVGQ